MVGIITFPSKSFEILQFSGLTYPKQWKLFLSQKCVWPCQNLYSVHYILERECKFIWMPKI